MRLVVFGHNDWWIWERQGFSGRNAALVRAMARRPEVESIAVVDTPRFCGRTSRPRERRGESITPVASNITAIRHGYPLPLPTAWRWARAVNDRIAAPSLGRRLRAHWEGDGVVVAWVADPRLAPSAARFPSDLLLFDAIDDWRYHSWAGLAAVKAGYRWVTRHADLVTAVNPGLLSMLQPGGTAVVVFNAVDAQRWRAQPDPAARALGSPLVAYAGTLEGRFDVQLACAVARLMPDTRFVLAGPVLRHFTLPSDAPRNLSHIGRLDATRVPGLIAAADATMVPHRREGIALTMDPLKLYEYLAAGKPVVSTVVSPNPAVASMITVATDAPGFAAALRHGLMSDSHEMRRRRMEAAAAQSWEARAEQLIALLQAAAADRPIGPRQR